MRTRTLRSRRLVAQDVAGVVGDEAAFAHVEQDELVAPRILHHDAAPDLDIERPVHDSTTGLCEGDGRIVGGVDQEVDFGALSLALEHDLGVGVRQAEADGFV